MSGAEYEIPISRKRRRRERRGLWLDVLLVAGSLIFSVIVLYPDVAKFPVVSMVKVVTGLVNSIISPGLIATGLVYVRRDDISLLLRWVLIISISCFFDVILEMFISSIGVRLSAQSTVISTSTLLLIGCILLMFRRFHVLRAGQPIYSWRVEVFNWPYFLVGFAIFGLAILVVLPNMQTAKPALFITSSNGSLAVPDVQSNRAYRIQVHVVNPSSKRAEFILTQYVDGVQHGPSSRRDVDSGGTWVDSVSIPRVIHKSRVRVEFVLRQVGVPSFSRTVWYQSNA